MGSMVYPMGTTNHIGCQYRASDRKVCPERATYTLLPDLYGPYRLHICPQHARQLVSMLTHYLSEAHAEEEALG